MKNTIYKKSLALHKKYRGKIEIISKVPIKNKNDLALVYTPGVAQVSIEINKNPKLVYNYTNKSNMVGIISDGSAVLGLGNIGPYAAIPVMEGKAILLKKFAKIDTFPICINTQNTQEIINFVKNLEPVFGAIMLEDISAPRCFEIEKILQKELPIPVMHDDQHGAATVVLAGLINALKLRAKIKHTISISKKVKENASSLQVSVINNESKAANIIINGAGAAGIAIAKLLLAYGFKNLIICDSQGAIYLERNNLSEESPSLTPHKKEIARMTNQKNIPGNIQGKLVDIIKNTDVFIGVSGPKLLTKEMVQSMAKNPIIFALANPEPEIMPEIAKRAGAFIVATGRSDFPNQINNSLVFPGLFRGALDNKIKQFNQKIFIRVAETLAKIVKNPTPNKILPDPFDPKIVEAIKKVVR
ncbi:MAG: NADP-dependent malic enzyme [Patescibacteria group bacterium]|mgnify:CR=1 FL=1